MPSYTTVKNTLKKLESRQNETDRVGGCGVIYYDEYEKLPPAVDGKSRQKNRVGYLVVPRPLTLSQWEAACAS